jgi:trans-feruloyl-CoA hydratase/vanillin synthase
MAATWKTIKVEINDGVALVTLNRPEKKNAMSPQLHEDMVDVLETLRYDDKARVVVITGAGDSFCAGMDLKEFFTELKDKPARYDRITRLAVEWRGRTLSLFPKPTIAMINGYCFGGAFSIVEGCDLAVASEDATFGLSEINFKMFPGGSVSKSLANLLRPRDAMLYAMTGRPFKGAEAARIGFVNYAVPANKLKDDVMALAKEIASKDPVALKCAKEAYRHSLGMTLDAAWSYTSAKESEVILAQNDSWRTEGIGDFLAGKYRPGLGGHEQVKR